jgi:transposase
MGPPSIDPVLMIRMLIIGYVFAIRSPEGATKQSRFTRNPLLDCFASLAMMGIFGGSAASKSKEHRPW